MTKIRLYFYLGSGLIAALLPILVSTGLIAADSSEAVKQLVASLGSLIGASGAITAGTILNKQSKEGVLDKLDPGAQIAQGAQALQDAQKQLEAQVRIGLDAVKGIAPAVPVLGPELEKALSQIKF